MTSHESEAKDHAMKLLAEYGRDAERIARDKLFDAPFLVNGEPEFWRLVCAYLELDRGQAA